MSRCHHKMIVFFHKSLRDLVSIINTSLGSHICTRPEKKKGEYNSDQTERINILIQNPLLKIKTFQSECKKKRTNLNLDQGFYKPRDGTKESLEKRRRLLVVIRLKKFERFVRRRQEKRGALYKGLREVGRDYVSIRREQKRKENICIHQQKGSVSFRNADLCSDWWDALCFLTNISFSCCPYLFLPKEIISQTFLNYLVNDF